jgi:hypothetical protein
MLHNVLQVWKQMPSKFHNNEINTSTSVQKVRLWDENNHCHFMYFSTVVLIVLWAQSHVYFVNCRIRVKNGWRNNHLTIEIVVWIKKRNSNTNNWQRKKKKKKKKEMLLFLLKGQDESYGLKGVQTIFI